MSLFDKNSVENCVFEGGGSRGFAYCGAIAELSKKGILQKCKRFAGASIGSLFAAMLAANFTADEICGVRSKIDFSSLHSGCYASSIYSVVRYMGVHSIAKIESQFRAILSERIDPDVTFEKLFSQTEKELVIVACCLNRRKAVYFHHAQYPHVKVIDALMVSIGVPYAFQPRKMNLFGTEDYMVDGGIVDNYPIWVFNELTRLYDGTLDEVVRENISPKTLGIKLLGQDENNSEDVYNGRKDISSLKCYSIELLNTLLTQIERIAISPSYIAQTIPIISKTVYFLDFDLTDKKIEDMMKHGSDAVVSYFA